MKFEKNKFLTTPTFSADDLDLEKTIFSEFGMKIEKNNFFYPAHFFFVDLDLDWNLFRLLPTLCTLFGIDALI